MTVKQSTIDQFRPQRANRNKHKERGMGALESSMRKLGYVAPITVAADGEAIDGSARLETSAIVFGDDVLVVEHDGQRPIVMVRTDIPNADTPEARQIAIAANRVAQLNLDFDVEGLLADAQSGLDLSGLFSQAELDEMLAELTPPMAGADTEPQADKAAELQAKWGTSTGQLWQLGQHRLICGDCTDRAVVERLMGGEKAALCLTDPPYGIKMDKGFEGFGGFGGFGPPIARRQYSDDWDGDRPDKAAFDLILESSKIAIVFGGNFFADLLPQSTHWLVWDKLNTMPTFGDCELAWTNIKRKSVKKYTVEYNGLIGKEKERYHPTQKPVAIMAAILLDYSQDGETIYDPFLGSGTTLIAAHNLNRRCFGCEISSAYAGVILQRFLDHTGIEPQLIES